MVLGPSYPVACLGSWDLGSLGSTSQEAHRKPGVDWSGDNEWSCAEPSPPHRICISKKLCGFAPISKLSLQGRAPGYLQFWGFCKWLEADPWESCTTQLLPFALRLAWETLQFRSGFVYFFSLHVCRTTDVGWFHESKFLCRGNPILCLGSKRQEGCLVSSFFFFTLQPYDPGVLWL